MRVSALIRESCALVHAETVLFVGHDKTGFFECHALREKRLRADDDFKRSVGESGIYFLLFRRRGSTDEQFTGNSEF